MKLTQCLLVIPNIYKADQVYVGSNQYYIQYIGAGPNNGLILGVDTTGDLNKSGKALFITPETALNDPRQLWRNVYYNSIKDYRLSTVKKAIGGKYYEIGLLESGLSTANPCYLLSGGNYEYQRFVLLRKNNRLVCNGYELTADESGYFRKVPIDITKPSDALKKPILRILTKTQLIEYIKESQNNVYMKLIANPHIYLGRGNIDPKVTIFNTDQLPSNLNNDDTKNGLWMLNKKTMALENPENAMEVLVATGDDKITLGTLNDSRLIRYDMESHKLYYTNGNDTDKKYIYVKLTFKDNNFSLLAGKEYKDYVDNMKSSDARYYDWKDMEDILDVDMTDAKDGESKEPLYKPVYNYKGIVKKTISQIDDNYKIK